VAINRGPNPSRRQSAESAATKIDLGWAKGRSRLLDQLGTGTSGSAQQGRRASDQGPATGSSLTEVAASSRGRSAEPAGARGDASVRSASQGQEEEEGVASTRPRSAERAMSKTESTASASASATGSQSILHARKNLLTPGMLNLHAARKVLGQQIYNMQEHRLHPPSVNIIAPLDGDGNVIDVEEQDDFTLEDEEAELDDGAGLDGVLPGSDDFAASLEAALYSGEEVELLGTAPGGDDHELEPPA